jgi:hypothetical protein
MAVMACTGHVHNVEGKETSLQILLTSSFNTAIKGQIHPNKRRKERY